MYHHFEDDKRMFWLGVNGMEYISWNGAKEVIEYDPCYYPIPARIFTISVGKINGEDDMYNAILNGESYLIDARKE